jgi:arylsulfatase A-like enzyme
MLLEYWDRDKLKLSEREVELAHDSYDDCIAALDRQLGTLLDELDQRGLLRDTVVIITSDHGEQFGEHGVFNHGFSLYADEVHVPLLIISRAAPAGCTISEPVSLRDLAATVVDLAGLDAGPTFPGRSLATYWRDTPDAATSRPTKALSEVDIPLVIGPERGRGSNQREFTVSLVADGLHYLLDVRGNEELYRLGVDPREQRDLKNDPAEDPALARFRDSLGEILRDNRITSGVAGNYQKRFLTLLASLIPRPAI